MDKSKGRRIAVASLGLVALAIIQPIASRVLVRAIHEFRAAVPLERSPSTFSDFHSFTTISNSGTSDPEAALQTLHYRMKNQQSEPLTRSIMKETWDLPADFGDSNVNYSVDLGEGAGGRGETGYRIASQKRTSSNQVRLLVEYETKSAGLFRRSIIFVERDGAWRQAVRAIRQSSGELQGRQAH